MTDPLRYDPARGWMSPEELLVEALDAVLDEADRRYTTVVAMARDALDDGNREVMRDCLTEIVTQLSSCISDDDQEHSDDDDDQERNDDDHHAMLLARLRAGKV